MIRGIIEPPTADLNQYLKTQKEREAHQFLVEGSYLAGDTYQLDEAEMKKQEDHVLEMDNTDVLQLDPATFNYHDGLTQIFRSCEDPFAKDIVKLTFQQNPAEPTKLIKALDLCSGSSGGNWVNRVVLAVRQYGPLF